MPVFTLLRESHQISRLRIRNASKLANSRVKLSCGSVLVRKTRSLVNGVNQMRTIVSFEVRSQPQRGRDDGEPIIMVQQPCRMQRLSPLHYRALLSCGTVRNACQKDHNRNSDLAHLMTISVNGTATTSVSDAIREHSGGPENSEEQTAKGLLGRLSPEKSMALASKARSNESQAAILKTGRHPLLGASFPSHGTGLPLSSISCAPSMACDSQVLQRSIAPSHGGSVNVCWHCQPGPDRQRTTVDLPFGACGVEFM
jgi:hypothetical protein